MGIETIIEEKCTDIDTLRIWISIIVGIGLAALFTMSYKKRKVLII